MLYYVTGDYPNAPIRCKALLKNLQCKINKTVNCASLKTGQATGCFCDKQLRLY